MTLRMQGIDDPEIEAEVLLRHVLQLDRTYLFLRLPDELTAFAGRVHKDSLPKFVELYTDVIVEPRFDPNEFERLRADAINDVKNRLRSQDDELLGKTALEALLYEGHPYARWPYGTVTGLSALTLDDVKAQWKKLFTQDRLVAGLAGPVDAALQAKVLGKLSALPGRGSRAGCCLRCR